MVKPHKTSQPLRIDDEESSSIDSGTIEMT